MTRLLTSPLALAAALGALTVTGCSSAAPTAVPASYLQGTPLDRNPITVAKRTEFLEIDIHPEASQLIGWPRPADHVAAGIVIQSPARGIRRC